MSYNDTATRQDTDLAKRIHELREEYQRIEERKAVLRKKIHRVLVRMGIKAPAR